MARGSAIVSKKVPLTKDWADFLETSSMTRADFTKRIWDIIRDLSGAEKIQWPVKIPGELQYLFGEKSLKGFSDVAKLQRRAFE